VRDKLPVDKGKPAGQEKTHLREKTVVAGGETWEKGLSQKCLSLWVSRYSKWDKAAASVGRQVLEHERPGIMHDQEGGMCTSCASSPLDLCKHHSKLTQWILIHSGQTL